MQHAASENKPSIDAHLLFARMIHVYQRADIKAQGGIIDISDEGSRRTATVDAADRVLCFEDFREASNLSLFANKRAAFKWYCRMRLRLTCSACCALFELVRVQLEEAGIAHIRFADGTLVETRSLRCECIPMDTPETVHCFRFRYRSGMAKNCDKVECGEHNILLSMDEAYFVDMTTGQFDGSMRVDLGETPEEILHHPRRFEVYPAQAVPLILAEEQLSYKDHARPEKDPFVYANTVVHEALEQGWKGMCANCLGFSSSLRYCGKCGCVQYCGEECQKMHWGKGGHGAICGVAITDEGWTVI